MASCRAAGCKPRPRRRRFRRQDRRPAVPRRRWQRDRDRRRLGAGPQGFRCRTGRAPSVRHDERERAIPAHLSRRHSGGQDGGVFDHRASRRGTGVAGSRRCVCNGLRRRRGRRSGSADRSPHEHGTGAQRTDQSRHQDTHLRRTDPSQSRHDPKGAGRAGDHEPPGRCATANGRRRSEASAAARALRRARRAAGHGRPADPGTAQAT